MSSPVEDDPNLTGQNGTESVLPDRQERAALLLACGRTVAAVSRECEIGATTLWSWKKRPEFNDRVAELRKELTDAAVGRLANMMSATALDALESILKIKGDNRVKLDAVRAVFELFGGVTSNLELRQVLEELQSKKGDNS